MLLCIIHKKQLAFFYHSLAWVAINQRFVCKCSSNTNFPTDFALQDGGQVSNRKVYGHYVISDVTCKTSRAMADDIILIKFTLVKALHNSS